MATPTYDGDYQESEDPDYENVPEVANSEGKSLAPPPSTILLNLLHLKITNVIVMC
jgi:hypothetical protein